MLRWAHDSFHKKRTGTRYANLVFLHPVGSAGHMVNSGASRLRNINALFFMLGWDWYGFDKKRARTLVFMIRWDRCGLNKKCAGTCYSKLIFLQPVGPVGHVVHSGASGP
jgi:hypothetical protein